MIFGYLRFYAIIWLIIFLGIFVFLSWPIFFQKKDNWAYGQLPLSEKSQTGPDSIFIPKIGLRTPIIFSQSEEKKDIERDLEKGIVRWPGTGRPGQNKNMALVGHSSSYFWQKTPYSQIFSRLDKLTAGDPITIFHGQKSYLYQVEKIEIVSSKSVEISPDESDLTLITCWPAGTTLKRLMVKAKMI